MNNKPPCRPFQARWCTSSSVTKPSGCPGSSPLPAPSPCRTSEVRGGAKAGVVSTQNAERLRVFSLENVPQLCCFCLGSHVQLPVHREIRAAHRHPGLSWQQQRVSKHQFSRSSCKIRSSGQRQRSQKPNLRFT